MIHTLTLERIHTHAHGWWQWQSEEDRWRRRWRRQRQRQCCSESLFTIYSQLKNYFKKKHTRTTTTKRLVCCVACRPFGSLLLLLLMLHCHSYHNHETHELLICVGCVLMCEINDVCLWNYWFFLLLLFLSFRLPYASTHCCDSVNGGKIEETI